LERLLAGKSIVKTSNPDTLHNIADDALVGRMDRRNPGLDTVVHGHIKGTKNNGIVFPTYALSSSTTRHAITRTP
jgi:hypothetical protein